MASKTLTSKTAPVVTGKGDDATTSFVATKVTGPDANNNYTSEIVQYDNAKDERYFFTLSCTCNSTRTAVHCIRVRVQ